MRTRRPTVRVWYARAVLLVLLVLCLQTIDHWSTVGDGSRDCLVQVRPASPEVAHRIDAPFAGLVQRGGTVNDASCVNAVPVHGVVRPTSVTEVQEALSYARDHGLKVAVGGTRHSMGGQASYPGGLVLDMTGMSSTAVDADRGTVRVGAGAPWKHVLEALHDEGLSVAAMPGIDILSVGGTVSVNAHGADFRTGSLAPTVRSLLIVTADGIAHRVSRDADPQLFRAAIGGYGLFGVIVEVELETVPDEVYRFEQRLVPTADVARVFEEELVPDDDVRMMYGHLSTSPGSFLDEVILYSYRRVDGPAVTVPPLHADQDSRVARLVLNVARTGRIGQRVKWSAQRHLLPHLRRCETSRNAALRAAEACLVSRNQSLYNGLMLLDNDLAQYTDVLHEYFLPPEELAGFLADARVELRAHDAQLLSASIRSVERSETLLSYAPDHRLSVVLYLSQEVSSAGHADMADLTRRLVAPALAHGGTFYLPYQQHYSRADLERGYPQIDSFFALKSERDPELLFMNSLAQQYGDELS
ncbi:FAD-binding oxidoreductase [Nocardioides cavernae]|uniref:FAD-binding oxidoreductase n=1 Tax=Nocardioides cavernae TaxID=1921566 RepID=A0ABR8NB62_9ACTN|nr:FAD-binding oxidoreductase [Nocardioides cavernae]MBD3925382.1 FAD-binding oxidoreductase [Nocardioides cavernae]MBM7514239.1 FAD/FMN-containing dehydrogenase [Nocardioides cavernae]